MNSTTKDNQQIFVEIQKKNGAKGGRATFKKHGSKHMSGIAKKRWKRITQ